MEKEKYREDPESGLWMIEESDPFKVPPISGGDWGDFENGPQQYSDQLLGTGFLTLRAEKGIDSRLIKFPIPRKKEWADFYSSQDYAPDQQSNLMVAAPTEKTCKAYDGFVCKVRYLFLSQPMIWGYFDYPFER